MATADGAFPQAMTDKSTPIQAVPPGFDQQQKVFMHFMVQQQEQMTQMTQLVEYIMQSKMIGVAGNVASQSHALY